MVCILFVSKLNDLYHLSKYVTIKYNYNIIKPVKRSVTGTMIEGETDMCVNNVNKKGDKGFQ